MKNESVARWMVVDDDTETLDAVSRRLQAVSDAEICSFPSPWQALDAFAAAPESFQLVVTDFEMPGMNGIDFRRHLQAVSPSAKVLLATGSGMFTPESARQKGFCGLLCKPFSIGTLKEALERLKKYYSHSAKGIERAVFLVFGFVSAQSQGLLNLLLRRSLSKNQKSSLRNGYSISLTAPAGAEAEAANFSKAIPTI